MTLYSYCLRYDHAAASQDFIERVGDCSYEFSAPRGPTPRNSVHREQNRTADLLGKAALLSERLDYFGVHPVGPRSPNTCHASKRTAEAPRP